VKEYAEFVLHLLDKLEIMGKVEIIAHSFGGRIAFYLAAKYPERVEKLFLAAPGGVENLPSATKKSLFNIGKKVLSLP
jgi:pimeloyl-ACP methyl ester carboxylesterase